MRLTPERENMIRKILARIGTHGSSFREIMELLLAEIDTLRAEIATDLGKAKVYEDAHIELVQERDRLRQALERCQEHLECLTDINQHSGYTFTQPLMAFRSTLQEALK